MFGIKEVRITVGALCVLVVLGACAYLLSRVYSPLPGAVSPATATNTPPLTPGAKSQLAASKGFQLLISYTDSGFEPARATIKKGDTVRFTNNSTQELWVAANRVSGAIYPGNGNTCGQSAFDSCHVLQYGEFWEFTFDTSGAWNYQNNADTKMTGIIDVK